LFPKYYLIYHSEFPKLLLYYSLRVDPLFHKIIHTIVYSESKMNKTNTPEIYVTQILHKNP